MNKLRNLLVCGTTKQGKTAYLKSRIESILAKGSADVEVIIIDSKRAGEYDGFADKVQVYKRFMEIESVLTTLHSKVLSRINGEPTDSKVVLVVDEYSDLMPGEHMPEKAKAILELTQNAILALAKEGPANGLVVFLATNQMKPQVLTDDLLSCFRQRVCFRVALKEESELIFPGMDAGAERLEIDKEYLVQDNPNEVPVLVCVESKG